MAIGRRRQKARELITPHEKVKLRELIEGIERETSGEICVVLMDHVEDPKRFALDYFNHLGIGKKELDNGILILVALSKRHIEIVVGRGVQRVVPQTFLDRVVHEMMAPHFRDGRFAHGLEQAVEAFGRMLREDFPKGPSTRRPQMPGVVDLGPGEHR